MNDRGKIQESSGKQRPGTSKREGNYGPRTPQMEEFRKQVGIPEEDNRSMGELIQEKRAENPQNFYGDSSIRSGTKTNFQSPLTAPPSGKKQQQMLIQRQEEPATENSGQENAEASSEVAGGTLTEGPAEAQAGSGEPAGLIVEDDVTPGPGQMTKTAFLNELQGAVCTGVDSALAGLPVSSSSCPYLARAFERHRGSSAAQIMAVARRYAPDAAAASTAQGLISAVRARAHAAASRWADSGDLSEVPPDIVAQIPAGIRAMGGLRQQASSALASAGRSVASAINSAAGAITSLFFKALPGGARSKMGPKEAQGRLGQGRPLEGQTRGRMEGALGTDLTDVRVHDGTEAVQMNKEMNSRAFAVGNQVAFGEGQYRPGEPAGDALLAHELAHVQQQQGGGSGSTREAEEDADAVATDAMANLASGEQATQEAGTGYRSRLALRNCGLFGGDEEEKEPAPAPEPEPEPEPEPPTPKEQFIELIRTLTADQQLSAADLEQLRAKATELGLDEYDVEDAYQTALDLSFDDDDWLGILTRSDDPVLRRFARTYSAGLPASGDLAEAGILALMRFIIADQSISSEEVTAITIVASEIGEREIEEAMYTLNFSDQLRSLVLNIIWMEADARAELERQGGYPIALATIDEKIELAGDANTLMAKVIMSDMVLDQPDFPILREMVQGLNSVSGPALLESHGFESTAARTLYSKMSGSEANFKKYVLGYKNLRYSFVLTEDGKWAFDSTTQFNVNQPFHPDTPSFASFDWTEEGEVAYHGGNWEEYEFKSGTTEMAETTTFEFHGIRFRLIQAASLVEQDTIGRLEEALPKVPFKHANLMTTLVLDPGAKENVLADAGHDGTVTVYYSGAGPNKSQSEINNTFVHEIGHLVSFEAANNDSRFWTKWMKAIRDDGLIVSKYGQRNKFEDFAEMYALVRSKGTTDATVSRNYPNRLALITPLM